MNDPDTVLTVSRRFAFSTSIRLARKGWSSGRNERAYGPASRARWGFGVNYVAHVVLVGPVDRETGMMVNLAEVKRRVGSVVDARYDHRFLNADTAPFGDLVPTAENVARQLLADLTPSFAGTSVHPLACHLEESPSAGAVAWSDGRVERFAEAEFSAARRTCSPRLSDAENTRLFGVAARAHGHGHNYRLRVVLAGEPDDASGLIAEHDERTAAVADVIAELDHRNLNLDVPWLEGRPVTTESLARELFFRLGARLPVDRVRLWELPHFSAEFGNGSAAITWRSAFHAAHRLHSQHLTDDENRRLYGKCNNPAGHGHRYVAEVATAGELDEVSGTVGDLSHLSQTVEAVLEPWAWVHLDREVAEFAMKPTSSENITRVLWRRLAPGLPGLVRLRLWETENNRFAVRRVAKEGA